MKTLFLGLLLSFSLMGCAGAIRSSSRVMTETPNPIGKNVFIEVSDEGNYPLSTDDKRAIHDLAAQWLTAHGFEVERESVSASEQIVFAAETSSTTVNVPPMMSSSSVYIPGQNYQSSGYTSSGSLVTTYGETSGQFVSVPTYSPGYTQVLAADSLEVAVYRLKKTGAVELVSRSLAAPERYGDYSFRSRRVLRKFVTKVLDESTMSLPVLGGPWLRY